MTRGEVKRRLKAQWWQHLMMTLLPPLIANFLSTERLLPAELSFPLFLFASACVFLSLPAFQRYKRALLEVERVLDSDEEPRAWIALAAVRRNACWTAALPAWLGAVDCFAGLSAIPLMMLLLGSLGLLQLYKIPPRLGAQNS